MKNIILIATLLLSSVDALATEWGQITPSHVYQKATAVVLELEILRNAIGIMDFPFEPEPQTSKTPIHVYSKGLEVLEKIGRAERKLGMASVTVGQIPLKPIAPRDVLGLVEEILSEITKIKSQLAIEESIEEVPFVAGRTPSHVYEELWRASYMLDGLTGPLSPNEVFRNAQYLDDELGLIAAKLKTDLELDPPPVVGRKRPKDASQQALLAFYKIANLQNRLRMDSVSVPAIILVRVTPSDVYDITNMLNAELVRIKVHLGVTLPKSPRFLPAGKSPSDVYGMMRLVNSNLDRLIRAAADNPALVLRLVQETEAARANQ